MEIRSNLKVFHNKQSNQVKLALDGKLTEMVQEDIQRYIICKNRSTVGII